MERNQYLEKIIRRKHNGLIKVITGIRHSGKSYLLFELFYHYLLKEGVDENHIIKIALDDRINKKYRNPDVLCEFVHNKIKDDEDYYILLDEVQMVAEFEEVLNSFLHIPNADTYVTGSNAKFLSKDIITEFRGRGDQVHIYPLSFAEYMQSRMDSPREAWYEYTMYGGLPKLLEMNEDTDKAEYHRTIFSERYIKDVLERNDVCNLGSKRMYIQSAYSMPTIEKEQQEERSLVSINDSFKKIIIVKDGITHYNEKGIYILNLFDFLMDNDSIDR